MTAKSVEHFSLIGATQLSSTALFAPCLCCCVSRSSCSLLSTRGQRSTSPRLHVDRITPLRGLSNPCLARLHGAHTHTHTHTLQNNTAPIACTQPAARWNAAGYFFVFQMRAWKISRGLDLPATRCTRTQRAFLTQNSFATICPYPVTWRRTTRRTSTTFCRVSSCAQSKLLEEYLFQTQTGGPTDSQIKSSSEIHTKYHSGGFYLAVAMARRGSAPPMLITKGLGSLRTGRPLTTTHRAGTPAVEPKRTASDSHQSLRMSRVRSTSNTSTSA